MTVQISSDAEQDIADGFWFYEGQTPGLGDYFRSSIIADIESLAFYGGIHEKVAGLYRSLGHRFPFAICYRVDGGRGNGGRRTRCSPKSLMDTR